jgi:hypothetical protein
MSGLIVVAAACWVFLVGRGLAPGVMPDELIYSVQSKYLPISEAEYGNYLYLLVYKVTSLFGVDSYSASQLLNAVFWILQSAAVFLLSRFFLPPVGSLGLMVIWGFSPVITYNFLFMPEAMYGAMVAWAIYFGVRALFDVSQRSVHFDVISSILFAAMAANVKPHAIFLLPALIILWQGSGLVLKSPARAVLRALSTLTLFWVFKLALGFVLAGSSGVNILPIGYAPWSDGADRTPKPYSTAYLGDGALPSDLGSPLEVLMNQSALFFLFVFVTLGPILLIITSLWRVASGRVQDANSDETLEARILCRLLLLAGNGIAIGFVFGYYYSVNIVDHSDRVVLRHMELFLFVVFLASAWALARGLRSSKLGSAIGLTLVGAATMLIIFDFGPGFLYLSTDSMMITSFGETSIWTLQLFLAAVFSVSIASNRLVPAAKTALYVSLALIPVAGFHSVTSYVDRHQPEDMRASAAASALVSLNLSDSQQLTIFAPDLVEAGSAAFVFGGENFEMKLASSGRLIGTSDLVETTSHLLVSSKVLLDPNTRGFSVFSSSEEYVLLKPDNRATSLAPAGTLLGFEGITLSTAYGLSGSSVVSTVGISELVISEVDPAASLLKIRLSLDPSVSNRAVTISYLGESATLEMSADGSSSEITVELESIRGEARLSLQTSLLNVIDLAEDQTYSVGLRLESVRMVKSSGEG